MFHLPAMGRIFIFEVCPVDCHVVNSFRPPPVAVKTRYFLGVEKENPETLYASKSQEFHLFIAPSCLLPHEIPLTISLHLADADMTLVTTNSPSLYPIFKTSPKQPFLKRQGTSFILIQVCQLSSKYQGRSFVLKFKANVEGFEITHVTRPFVVKAKPPPSSAQRKRQRRSSIDLDAEHDPVPLAPRRFHDTDNAPMYNRVVEICEEMRNLTFRLSKILEEETLREARDLDEETLKEVSDLLVDAYSDDEEG
jgi:hypothetical protein